ncbi:MAG: RNA pseudouridine synthase [Saprospiraceae bacterium]|nr:RNA pseudouridine synthase [Saprospiraceae bacterium]
MKISLMKNNPDLNKLLNLGKKKELYTVLDENDDFILVWKSYGIAVQATSQTQIDLEKILTEKYKQPIYVLNRIDQPVSGLVIFGKNKTFTEAFTHKIKERDIKKTYLAIVSGTPAEGRVYLKHFLKKLHNRSMSSDEPMEDYKEAELYYEKVQQFDNYSLLKIELITGRYHQIRAQLATMDMPIKGDLKYGSRRPNLDRSICLLSYKLEFADPLSGKHFSYKSPLPDNDVLWSMVDETNL